MKTPSETNHQQTPNLPSQGVQSLITFLLVIHLFALFVALASNSNSASIHQQLREEVPGILPYLQVMAMDQAYTFSHYETGPQYIEAKLTYADGTEEILRIPPANTSSGHRLLRLNKYCEDFAGKVAGENPEQDDILSRALASYLITHYQAKNVEINCMQQELIEEEADQLPEELQPYQSIYKAVYIPFRGVAQILKSSPPAQVAPVIKPKK